MFTNIDGVTVEMSSKAYNETADTWRAMSDDCIKARFMRKVQAAIITVLVVCIIVLTFAVNALMASGGL